MERGSDKHGARMDDALEHEVEGLVRAGHDTRGEEWKSAEPSGEDQPDVDLVPDGTLTGGVPEGMTEGDVAARAEIASFLGKEIWPADREALIARAGTLHAPDRVLDRLRQLPEGIPFANMQEVWTNLQGGVEAHRF
jgi:hypothetical protein